MGTHPTFNPGTGPSAAYQPRTRDASDQSVGGTVLPQVDTTVFQPARTAAGTGATTRLAVGTSATTAPVALPALAATAYRARVPAAAAAPVTFILTTDTTKVPVIPVAYTTAGTGGTPGDKTIDPGGVEVIGLSDSQITALAAGTLYLSAISTGASEIFITPGFGA